MGKAKEIIVKVIPARIANNFVMKYHYSRKKVNNSCLHFGCFLNNTLHGVMSFGPPMDKRKLLGLVKRKSGEGTAWSEIMELNRIAFDDTLPKNSESRCIGIAMRLLRKNAGHVKWIVSFSDAMQCGDGCIYRAAGFHLTGYSKGSVWKLPEHLHKLCGSPFAHRMLVQDKSSKISKYILNETKGKNLSMKGCVNKFGGEILPGFMFRYIKILDKNYVLDCPVYDYSKTKELLGGTMYKGELLKEQNAGLA
jgi:hypothetical protein